MRLNAEEKETHRRLVEERVSGSKAGVLLRVPAGQAVPPRVKAINQSFVVTRGGFAPPEGVVLEGLTPAELFSAAVVLGRALARKARELYAADPGDGPAAALRRARASARIDKSDRLINGCDVLNAHAPCIRRGRWSCHDALSVVRGKPRGAESAAGDIKAYFFSFVPVPALVPFMGIESWDSSGQPEVLVYPRASMGPKFVPDYAQVQSSLLAYLSNLHTRRVLKAKEGRTDFMVDDFITTASRRPEAGGAVAGAADGRGVTADLILDELVKIQTIASFTEAREKRLAGATRGRRLGRIVDSEAGTFSLPAATMYRYMTDLVIFSELGRDATMRNALMGKTCSVLAGKFGWLAASSALAEGRLTKVWAASYAKQPSDFTALMGGALEDVRWWMQQLGNGLLEPLRLLPPPGESRLMVTSSDASDVAICAVVWRERRTRGGVGVYRALRSEQGQHQRQRRVDQRARDARHGGQRRRGAGRQQLRPARTAGRRARQPHPLPDRQPLQRPRADARLHARKLERRDTGTGLDEEDARAGAAARRGRDRARRAARVQPR